MLIVIDLGCQAIPHVERYLPEPAMGNMKPESAGYMDKYNEKRARQLAEASSSPLFGTPTMVEFCVPGDDGTVCTTPEKFCSEVSADQLTVVGARPHRDVRCLINYFLRKKGIVPACLIQAVPVSIWRIISSEVEYPEMLPPLGRTPDTPIHDTLWLLEKLGLSQSEDAVRRLRL